jgi:hypothetical protein
MQIKVRVDKGQENDTVAKLVEAIMLDGGTLQALNFDSIDRSYTATINGIDPKFFAAISGKSFDYQILA